MLFAPARLAIVCLALLLSAGDSLALTPARRAALDGASVSDRAALADAFDAARHEMRSTREGFGAFNPGQRWSTSFDGRGFTTRPANGDWTWGLELSAYGFAGAMREVVGTACATADGGRLEYRWDDVLSEWFVIGKCL